ncbi:uncharacterized protein VP01_331g7 [Puccinia sorghi]|uniref:Cytochrome b5 heme-binding domain-containing protein n=1 Tax=Puccinia sorghi TaxID=27349 RepID=A0A0L6UY52_9BASI|nr:uncharacterized protein VP01_331g7 [Puccinia sorghi]
MFSFFGFPGKSTTTPQGQHNTTEPSSSEEGPEPPLFPAQNSIQRASSTSHPILRVHSPENDDEEDQEEEETDSENRLHNGLSDSLALPHATRRKPPKPRKKTQLKPGFSQLDWAKLKTSGVNLRGESVTSIGGITRAELGRHKSKQDAWTCIHGKVYNMTPYLDFHPGGVRELLQVAGKDGSELFMKTHAWISVDGLLDSCLVGFLLKD